MHDQYSPTQPHFHIHQLTDCYRYSLINYQYIKKTEALWCPGKKRKKKEKEIRRKNGTKDRGNV